MLLLEVQPAQHAPGAFALVVLYKGAGNARGSEFLRLIGLHKITPAVAEHRRFDDDHAGDLGCDKIEFAHKQEQSSPVFSFRSRPVRMEQAKYRIS